MTGKVPACTAEGLARWVQRRSGRGTGDHGDDEYGDDGDDLMMMTMVMMRMMMIMMGMLMNVMRFVMNIMIMRMVMLMMRRMMVMNDDSSA